MKGKEMLEERVSKCEDIEELRQIIFPMFENRRRQWSYEVKALIEKSGYTKIEFAMLCKLGRGTVHKWCNGIIPDKKETFRYIGMASGCNIEKLNYLIRSYGGYEGLYAKNLEDFLCMYVLGKYHGEDAVIRYDYLLDKMKEILLPGGFEKKEDIKTDVLDAEILRLADEKELELFAVRNAPVFSSQFERLNKTLLAILNEKCASENANSISHMAQGQSWSASLRKCVSNIRQNKWYPSRMKIISLGLHLGLRREEIDQLLEQAHMDKLCIENAFDCVIIFVITDAILKDLPKVYGLDAFCIHAKETFGKLDMQEFSFFMREIEEID